MIPKGLFTQIGMVIIAIAIIVTYVQPAFGEIGGVQDEIVVYQDERKKVADVNGQLDELVSRLKSVSNDDETRLLTYLPDEIDAVHVQRDLLLIAEQAGILVRELSYSGEGSKTVATSRNRRDVATQEERENLPTIHTFTLSVEGTFDQIKNLFSVMEQNHYPMEVNEVNITGKEGNFLDAEITFATYVYKLEDVEQKVTF